MHQSVPVKFSMMARFSFCATGSASASDALSGKAKRGADNSARLVNKAFMVAILRIVPDKASEKNALPAFFDKRVSMDVI